MNNLKLFIILTTAFNAYSCNENQHQNQTEKVEPSISKPVRKAINQSNQGEVSLEFYQSKHKAGINFYAVGNEPFWALDMGFEKGFQLKTPDFEYNCPPTEPELAQDEPIERYRIETESGEMLIRLHKTKCTDNMSGQEFSHKVSVSFKRGIDSNFTEYKGCGRYVPDVSLHDIWGLIEFNGQEIPNDQLKKGAQIELFPVDERVIFSDGCNSYNGMFYTTGNEIRFGNLAGTLMACPDMEGNEQLGAALAAKNYTYQRTGQILVFYSDSTAVFKWRKMD